jgi:hypothetical protein
MPITSVDIPIRRYAHLLREVMCRAASFKVRELICPCIAVAADLDGTFAVARMRPCFQVAVQIAAVVAARPGGGSVVFGSVTVGLGRLCRGGTWPRKDVVAPDRRAPPGGPLHNKLALLLALAEWNYIRKISITSRDGRI